MHVPNRFRAALTLFPIALACAVPAPPVSPVPSTVPEESTSTAAPQPAPRFSTSIPSNLPRFADAEDLRNYLRRVDELEALQRAHAQRKRSDSRGTTNDSWEDVEETIVTGSQPADSANSTTTPYIAFDASPLSALGAENVSDLAAYTPNLEVTQADSITNNQERGVDEGDIVKRVGEFLVVLRRGRIYSIETGRSKEDVLRLADVEDVFPYAFPHSAWYDEMLVDGDRIVVLGYSYETEATELSLFELDRSGRLHHRASHAIRSGDYYSWENYGSRLVDRRLVIYAPIDLDAFSEDRSTPWPVFSTYGRRGLAPTWQPLVDAVEIIKPLQEGFPRLLHTVIECEIAAVDLDCSARGVVGNEESIHFVSRRATYLWIHGGRALFDPMTIDTLWFTQMLESGELDSLQLGRWYASNEAIVVRIPFARGSIGVVEVEGAPFDQFSFREAEGLLDLFLVRPPGSILERTTPTWARVPIEAFDRPLDDPEQIDARILPGDEVGWPCTEQRFIGDRLLYAECREEREGKGATGVHVVSRDSIASSSFIATTGPIGRIEPVGHDALIVSTESDDSSERVGTRLLPVRLRRDVEPRSSVFLPDLVEIENRSHAFNYTAHDPGYLMGLPFADLALARRWTIGSSDLALDLADPPSLIAFFMLDERGTLSDAGRLGERRPANPPPDDCETSCYDWYGSVRPIFLDGRIMGLIGDELVEGRLGSRGIHAIRRIRLRGK